MRKCLVSVVGVLLVGAVVPHAASAGRPDTAALQIALRALNLGPGPIDGVSGPATRGAVRRLQRRKHLSVDGVPGPKTRRALGRRGRPSLGARAMHSGQRGWDIAALQYLLNVRGFEPGGFDGGFGPNTNTAVEHYQAATGLTVDGVAGPSTLGALRHRRVTSSSGTSDPDGPVRFLRPISGTITSPFGMRWGQMHNGIDIGADTGTPIGAAGVGVVSFAGWNDGGYGNLVVIRHRLGFESWYGHMSSIAASVGESVQGGTIIGYVGSTGHSTGPHLHFEVREFGTPVDPMPRLLSATAARAGKSVARRGPCRPNGDAWNTRDSDPRTARIDRCP